MKLTQLAIKGRTKAKGMYELKNSKSLESLEKKLAQLRVACSEIKIMTPILKETVVTIKMEIKGGRIIKVTTISLTSTQMLEIKVH